jgi:starch synthase (maltosyl-transferring)
VLTCGLPVARSSNGAAEKPTFSTMNACLSPESPAFPQDGRCRAIIEAVTPELDAGQFPIKRTLGERVTVEADIFADGHDALSAVVKYRPEKAAGWSESPMRLLVNDRWRGEFPVTELGTYRYQVEAWVDQFKSWRTGLEKKINARQTVELDLLAGVRIIESATKYASALDAAKLQNWAREIAQSDPATGESPADRALDPRMAELMGRYLPRSPATTCSKELDLLAEPPLARFGAWYEMFPRSCAPEPGRHGTLKNCEAQLPRIAGMGFDVLYLPPIHPIGRTLRKGRNNNRTCQPGEPGSPWAIGSAEGGHKSVHPELGTLEDFRHLVERARGHGLQVALDIAFQCSPDHPYVTAHPEWFRHRLDGSIQYAENPPKKYEDIFPFDFECEDWRGLWRELKSIFDFWIEQGVRIFRVDNPHTKAFPFWEWCLAELKGRHQDLIFLAEAFTRPKVMRRLAKLGFTQSYNYFPWRNSKEELIDYFTELTQSSVAEFLRPNLWANTPDILTQYLQQAGRTAFMVRLVLAATLGASYGIYGPAFELCENTPREPDSEEYLNSEKYEIRHWNLAAPESLQDLITLVNRIRRENPALQFNHRLAFHAINNDRLLAYTKSLEDGSDTILTIVNLDAQHTHSGWLELPLEEFHLDPRGTYQMHDLLTGARFLWNGARNFVELNPQYSPAHIFRLRHQIRSERDFDYFF